MPLSVLDTADAHIGASTGNIVRDAVLVSHIPAHASQFCLSVASALSSAHILAGGDQCSLLAVRFISDVLVSGITVPSTTSCPTRSTGAAGMPRRNQGVHLPWRPRRVPQDARAPTGPAVKKPIRAAIPCSNPVAVERTRTRSVLLLIGSGVETVMSFVCLTPIV